MNASEIRAKLAEHKEPTIERTFSPGITLTVGPISLPPLVACGLLPEHFYRAMMEAEAGTNPADLEQVLVERWGQMSKDERYAAAIFMPRLVMMVVRYPQIVAGAARGDDELSLLEIPQITQAEIMGWVLAGCPGIPVQMKGGEVHVKDLDLFRPKRPGGEPFTLEPDGSEVREAAE